jgi:DNA mismatch repair ATPase MutS
MDDIAAQIVGMKRSYPGYLILLKVSPGFFEAVGEDALVVADHTPAPKRQVAGKSGTVYDVASIPYFVVDEYICMLVQAGYRIVEAEWKQPEEQLKLWELPRSSGKV